MTTFAWQIDNMTRISADGFVVSVLYSVVATEGQFTASTFGTTGYEQTAGSFIPYDQLTEDIVLQWVYESVGKQKIEDYLQTQLDVKINPVVQNGLPWKSSQAQTVNTQEPAPIVPDAVTMN